MNNYEPKFYPFYKLNEKSPWLSLQENEHIDDISLILQYHDGKRRSFCKFPSYIECFKWISKIAAPQQNFFETIRQDIRGGIRKIYYDIDIVRSTCPSDMFNIEYAEKLKDKIICLTLKHVTCNLNKIMVCSSHGENKLSYHIIFNQTYLPNHLYCKEIYKLVNNELDYQEQQFLDGSVYKSIQQFRLLGSQKPNSGRPKIFHKKWVYKNTQIEYEYDEQPEDEKLEKLQKFKESLITWTMDLVPEQKKVTLPNENKKVSLYSMISSDIDMIKLNELIPDTNSFSVRGIHNNIVMLNRLKPSYCEVCLREHQNENPCLLIIGNKQAVYWDCRRSDGTTKFLGY